MYSLCIVVLLVDFSFRTVLTRITFLIVNTAISLSLRWIVIIVNSSFFS